MDYFKVKNLDKFQHYKNRCPPWIKLHRSIMEDYEFSCLQDASKLHLILIWLLASQVDNKIPCDEKWIKKKLDIAGNVNLKPLFDNGFIEYASKTLADRKQSAPSVETETEGYKQETEKHLDQNEFDQQKGFKEFWTKYPRKLGKSKAIGKYCKTIKTSTRHELLMLCLDKYMQSVDYDRTHTQPDLSYKHGSTFMMDWQDFEEYEVPAVERLLTNAEMDLLPEYN